MSKAKTTRQLSDEHEEYLVDAFYKFHARRSPSSGASAIDPNDVITDMHVIEAKATEKGSITIKKSDWQKIRAKAFNGRTPAMAFRFKDDYTGESIDLFTIEVPEYTYIRERLEHARSID
jgi:Holliday junction resolvase